MRISVFGLGYVGCVSLGCLAQNGHSVLGVDTVEAKVDLINTGKPTIIEKDIDVLVNEHWHRGNLRATTDYFSAVCNTDISIVCVGTPSLDNGHLSMTSVFQVAEQIADAIRKKDTFHVVVVRSTVLPGSNFKIGELIEARSGRTLNVDFAIISNPEFLREGSAVADFSRPAITVIGGDNRQAIDLVREMYQNVDASVIEVGIEVAEIIKFVNNSFHALKVTFANEVGRICSELGINGREVMDLFVKDKRLNISASYLKPGFTYGGSCLPKDLKGLRALGHDSYVNSPVLDAIEVSNEVQMQNGFERIAREGKRKIGLVGLSFKAGTDDLRCSPMVEIAEKLIGKGYAVLIYDKQVKLSQLRGANKSFINKYIPHLSELISSDISYVIDNSEVIVLGHSLADLEFDASSLNEKIVVDLCGDNSQAFSKVIIRERQDHTRKSGLSISVHE